MAEPGFWTGYILGILTPIALIWALQRYGLLDKVAALAAKYEARRAERAAAPEAAREAKP